MANLNGKYLDVLDKAKLIFGTNLDSKIEAVLHKIINTQEIELVTYTDEMVKDLLNDVVFDSNLFKKCIMPPFSVLDTKQGEWRSRKQLLDEYLGSSIAGRKESLAYGDTLKVRVDDNGTSQFDSVLAEILLKWFGFSGCNVYDSFGGGHIRGTMSALLGYTYTGIELATDQVIANKQRYDELKLEKNLCTWINDDSLNVDRYVEDSTQDLFFSCPPYGDLEQYTDDPRDLSSMDYQDFLTVYREIIRKGLQKLKPNRFACFVVGDFRDTRGFYRAFVSDTIKAFTTQGAGLYNELILLNNIGTAPMRASAVFNNRKMVKIHQNVLVFFKGDPDKIQDTYKPIDSKLPIPTFEQTNLFQL